MRRGSDNRFIFEGEYIMKSIMRLIVLLLILTACSPIASLATVMPTLIPSRTFVPSVTSIPSETPTLMSTITPTFTITPTSTPQPPLAEHEWSPETVLISIREGGGDGGMSLGDLGPPPFILYADGSLFVTQHVPFGDYYKTQVLVKKLHREEVCQHLNTLDQAGYLDYDSSNYTFNGDKPYGIGGPSTFIDVNAWKSKSDQYYDLGNYLREDIIRELYGQKGYPVISPALQDTYRFLYQYPMDDFEVYKPDRLAIWFLLTDKKFLDTFNLQAKVWELESMPLVSLINEAELLPDRGDLRSIILSGQEAQLLYDYFGNLIGSDYFFTEDPKGGKNYYEVFVRPLLPYEMPGEYHTGYMSILPVPDVPKPNFKLTCYPTDGVLPISTP
jgi:hypothetical protein